MTSPFEPLERVPVATITKNQREELRVELLRMPDSKWRLQVRVFYRHGDEWHPGRNGFTLQAEALRELAAAVNAAVGEARDRGMIE